MRSRVATLTYAFAALLIGKGSAAAECGKLEGPFAVFSYFSEAGRDALLEQGKQALALRGVPPERVYMGHLGTGHEKAIRAAGFRFAPVLSPPRGGGRSYEKGKSDGLLAGRSAGTGVDAWQFNEISHSASRMVPKSKRLDPKLNRYRLYLAGFIDGLREGTGKCGFVFIDRPTQFANAIVAEQNRSFDELARSVKRSAHAALGEEYPEFRGRPDLDENRFLPWLLDRMGEAGASIQKAIVPYVAVITPGFIRAHFRRDPDQPCRLERESQRMICPCFGKEIPLGGEPPGENADSRGHARRWRELYVQERVKRSVAGGTPLAGLGAWAFRGEAIDAACKDAAGKRSGPSNEDPAVVREVVIAIASGLKALDRR